MSIIAKEIIERVSHEIAGEEYGKILSHIELARMLEQDPCSRAYYGAIARVNKVLTEQGKMIENIHKLGYRIVRPDDYSTHALSRYKQGARAISKGERVLRYAPVQDMSESGRIEYRAITDRAFALRAHMEGAIVELKLISRKHPLRECSRDDRE